MSNRSVDYSVFNEVAVERVVSGHSALCALSIADRAEIVRRMAKQQYSDGQIAYRLGLHPRSVLRIRARRGIASQFWGGNGRLVHDFPTIRSGRGR